MNRELKIGFVALVAIIALILGLNYLKGLKVFSTERTFYAVYEDIGGLQLGSPVLINGYKVGMVSDISLLATQNQNLLVSFSIDQEFNIPVNSLCRIVNQDLMGSKGVSLILSKDTLISSSGDTLKSDMESSLQEEVNAQILPLKNKAEELIGSVDSVMAIVTAVLNKDTRQSLTNSLQSLDKTFALMSETMVKVDSMVDKNDERIAKVIKNLESITTNLESGNGEVKRILENFASLSDSLAQSNITATLQNVNAITNKINQGEGSIGLLMKDDKLYKNFEESTKQLAALLEDIKLNPKRYVTFSIIGGGKKSYQEPKSE